MVFETFLSHIIPTSWSNIACAWLKKYPDPNRPDIKSVDIVDTRFKNGVLTLTRIVYMEMNLPNWIKNVFGIQPMVLIERAKIDPFRSIISTKGSNITHRNHIVIEEEGEYYGDVQMVTFDRRARAKITNEHCWFSNKIEQILLNEYKKNSIKGIEILEEKLKSKQPK